jgi:hypothetical protein
VKRKTLTLLTASFILLASSFTFSSCKACDKEKSKPPGRDGNANNTSSDTKTSSGTTDGQTTDDNSKTTSGSDSKTTDDQTTQYPVISGGNGKAPCGTIIQYPVIPDNPTQTLEELEAEIIKLVNAAGKVGTLRGLFDAYDDYLLRNMQDLALSINNAVDIDVNVKEWSFKVYNMWVSRYYWVCAIKAEFIDDKPCPEIEAQTRTEAKEYGLEAGGLYPKAEPGLAKIRDNKEFDGILKQRPEDQINMIPAESDDDFIARKEKLHDNLVKFEGKMGDEADRIWKELTRAVDTYRNQKVAEGK